MPMRLVLALLACLLLQLPSQASPPKKGKWIRVQADGIELYSNAREAKAVEVAVRLEQFRRVLAHTVPGFSHKPLESTRVVLFKNGNSLEPYIGMRDPRAYYLRNSFESFIVLNATPASITRARGTLMQLNPYTFFPYHDIYHEFVHYLVDSSLSGLPVWLNEGLAEYYATFTIKKDEAVIGLPVEVVLLFLGDRWDHWLPPSTLFEESPFLSSHSRQTALFYAESWAVIHYLTHAGKERKKEFENYLMQLARGMPQERAFDRSFSVDPDELLLECRRHIAGEKLPYLVFDSSMASLEVEAEVSKLSHKEVLCLLGSLLVTLSPFKANEAEEYFEAALAIDASHAEAHFGMATASDAGGKLNDAAEHYRKAIALTPAEGRFRLRFGFNRLAAVEELLYEGSPGEIDLAPMLAEARAAFSAGIALGGGPALAHLGLGRTYLYEDDIPAAAFSALDSARQLAPDDGQAPLIMALLKLREGRKQQAMGVMRGALRTYPFHFLTALEVEMGRMVLPVAYGHALYEPQLRQVNELLQSMAGEQPRPLLPPAVEWDDIEPGLESLKIYARLLDAGRAVAAEEGERARELLDGLLAELEGVAAPDPAKALADLLDEE